MKSACLGGSGVEVWVRITSRVGTTGAASSWLKPTPRMSTPKPISDSASVALSRSVGPIFRNRTGAGGTADAAAGDACSFMSLPFRAPGLDHVEQSPGDIEPELLVKFAHAGGAGHVDFSQEIADHIQADEDHATTA